MNALRVLSFYITAIKLLVAIPYLFIAIAGIMLLVSNGWTHDGFILLSVLVGAIGLGYPFSLFGTKSFLTWVIVIFSAVPFCSTMLLLPMSDLDSWETRGIALLLPVLTLTDLRLSKKLQAVPGRLSVATRVLIIGCAVLSLAIVITSSAFFASRGRPYQPPAIAFHGDSADLHQSAVVPTLDTPMPKGKSVVWCATLQLAWNRLGKDVLHEPPQVHGAETTVSRLNAAQFDESDLPPDSYLATTGFANDGIVEKVRSEMKRRFQREVEIDPMEPNNILAYAYLEANAAFTIPFFDNRSPFHFRDSSGKETTVTSFGIEEQHEYAYESLRKQVDVLYLLRKNNSEKAEEFVLDLCRDSTPNQIVVACVSPKATLFETLKYVEKKTHESAGHGRGIGIRDVLLVPNLNWEVRHHFAELEGSEKRLLNVGVGGYYIAKALQTIRFKLDRSGAEVNSESQIVCKPGATHFLFDRPFLIVVKKRGAERPFFVMWVDNAELLCKP